jgi:hypothetical protein
MSISPPLLRFSLGIEPWVYRSLPAFENFIPFPWTVRVSNEKNLSFK